jgi:hypothetical protein
VDRPRPTRLLASESMARTITKASRYGLLLSTSDGGRGPAKVETTDLPALTAALGEDVLVHFLRCFVSADRLQSLGGFLLRAQGSEGSITRARDLQTVAWFGGGVLYEAVDALEGLARAGLPPACTSSKEWVRLQALAVRWRTSQSKKLRNGISFHVAEGMVRKGLRRAIAEDERVTILGGDDRSAGKTSLALGMQLLLHGTGWSEAEFKTLVRDMMKDHLRFSSDVQEVFKLALKDKGASFWISRFRPDEYDFVDPLDELDNDDD